MLTAQLDKIWIPDVQPKLANAVAQSPPAKTHKVLPLRIQQPINVWPPLKLKPLEPINTTLELEQVLMHGTLAFWTAIKQQICLKNHTPPQVCAMMILNAQVKTGAVEELTQTATWL